MKNILLFAMAALALTACKKDNDGGKTLDPMAKISIRPATQKSGVSTKATYLTPVEVVRQATDIVLVSPNYPDEPWVNAGISPEQKDLTTPKIMMWGMWVIENGEISRDFVEATNVILVTREGINYSKPISDTIAYIPNATLRAAEVKIKAAFAKEDFDEVYRLFDEAYRFTPINGKDWLALKKAGQN